jgi:hypothetical protein
MWDAPRPDDLLVKPPRLGLGLHSKLSLQRVNAQSVLSERFTAAALTLEEPHQFPVDCLLRRIERQNPHGSSDGGPDWAGAELMSQQLEQSLQGQLPKALPLHLQPFFERRLLHPDALEKITLVKRGGCLQGRDRAIQDQGFEPGDVNVEASRLERHFPMIRHQDRVGPQRAAQCHESLAQALTRVLVTSARPEQCRQLVAQMPAPRRYRQVGEQGLRLVVTQKQGGIRAQTGLKASEEDEGEFGCQDHSTVARV